MESNQKLRSSKRRKLNGGKSGSTRSCNCVDRLKKNCRILFTLCFIQVEVGSGNDTTRKICIEIIRIWAKQKQELQWKWFTIYLYSMRFHSFSNWENLTWQWHDGFVDRRISAAAETGLIYLLKDCPRNLVYLGVQKLELVEATRSPTSSIRPQMWETPSLSLSPFPYFVHWHRKEISLSSLSKSTRVDIPFENPIALAVPQQQPLFFLYKRETLSICEGSKPDFSLSSCFWNLSVPTSMWRLYSRGSEYFGVK